ncbi:hypothetical protein LLG10_02720 [bacterium]|nr:hypothetical protein [bacterium]
MKLKDVKLIKKIVDECKDIIRYTNKIDEKMFLENDIYQKATAMSLLKNDVPLLLSQFEDLIA